MSSEGSGSSTGGGGTTNAGTDNSGSSTISNTAVVGVDSLRRANASGKIPVQLTLSQTSLSSGIPPQPQHILLGRQTFLHLGLESSVRKLHEHALPTLSFLGSNTAQTKKMVVQEDDSSGGDDDHSNSNSNSNSQPNDETGDKSSDGENDEVSSTSSLPEELPPYPICWFEDIRTGHPLRWQYFAGILFDSLHSASSSSTPQQSQSQSQPQPQPQTLPWEIRLHFRSYPSPKLLELVDPNWGHTGGVLETVNMCFRNSLKQGLTIRYGNSKEALNLSKQSHDAIWEGIASGDYDKVAPVVYRDDEFDDDENDNGGDEANESNTDVPKSDSATDPTDQSSGKAPEPKNNSTAEEGSSGTSGNTTKPNFLQNNNLVMIPVRLSVDPTKPMIQKRIDGGSEASRQTLGSLLMEWAPSRFTKVGETYTQATTADSSSSSSTEIRPADGGVTWRVAGLVPPLSTPLLDLWLALRHPDNFLYVSLSIGEERLKQQ